MIDKSFSFWDFGIIFGSNTPENQEHAANVKVSLVAKYHLSAENNLANLELNKSEREMTQSCIDT